MFILTGLWWGLSESDNVLLDGKEESNPPCPVSPIPSSSSPSLLPSSPPSCGKSLLNPSLRLCSNSSWNCRTVFIPPSLLLSSSSSVLPSSAVPSSGADSWSLLLCFFRSKFRQNPLLQRLQEYGLASVCVCMWKVRLYSWNSFMYCIHVLYSCAVLIYCIHVLYSCTVFMYCIHVLYLCTVFMCRINILYSCSVFMFCIHVPY